jgi:hypothetical protein
MNRTIMARFVNILLFPLNNHANVILDLITQLFYWTYNVKPCPVAILIGEATAAGQSPGSVRFNL